MENKVHLKKVRNPYTINKDKNDAFIKIEKENEKIVSH